MVLKLHGLPMSTCTTRVMICLHEKALDFELIPVDLFSQENKQPPFLAKNVEFSSKCYNIHFIHFCIYFLILFSFLVLNIFILY